MTRPADPRPPLLGRFVLREVLGQGGTASVHRALDRRRGEQVALKLLAPAMARRLKMQQRFRREAELLAMLDHPHIVRVLDVGEDDGVAWIAMELVEGESLAAWSDRHGPMPARMATGALLQIADAIAAAHAKGVVHRDIKPANVLVAPGGICRVVDFGIARGQDLRVTRTGVIMGTKGFMAPEQQADARSADERADVFSLGATLFALLTGTTPRDMAVDLPQAADALPPSLAHVIMRATLPTPAHRYPGAPPLAVALARATRALPPDPPGTPALHIPRRPAASPADPTLIPEDL